MVGGTYETLVLKELHRTEETALASYGSARTTLGPGERTHKGAIGPFCNGHAVEFDK